MDTPTPAVKKPSKLFTEYYGSVFMLMVLTFLVITALILKPKLDDVKTTNAQITSVLGNLENERGYLNSLEQSISAAKTISPTVLEQVDRALPRAQGVPELLVLFGETSDRDGVKISSVTFSDTAFGGSTSTVKELNVNLLVTAQNYPQIKKFIRDLEVSLRLLDITGINVTTQDKDSAYALQLKTYVYGR